MQRKLSVPDLAVFAVVMGGRRAAEGRRFKLGSFGVRWMSQLLAPARRRHADQRLKGGGKCSFQPARQHAAVFSQDAAADSGTVRQLRKSRDAAARREALFKKSASHRSDPSPSTKTVPTARKGPSGDDGLDIASPVIEPRSARTHDRRRHARRRHCCSDQTGGPGLRDRDALAHRSGSRGRWRPR